MKHGVVVAMEWSVFSNLVPQNHRVKSQKGHLLRNLDMTAIMPQNPTPNNTTLHDSINSL